MMLKSLSLALFFATTATAQEGSFWVQYGGDAPDSCIVPDGQVVDDSCCTNSTGDPFYVDFVSNSTCFVIAGLLGENGGSLQSFLGCAANGEIVYGEGCYNNGEKGGLIPPDVVVDDFDAATIEECGCTFQVSGKEGCYKIRDFSVLPGFESDPRQVFVYLNETCSGDDESGDGTSSTLADKIGFGSTIFVLVATFAVVFV